MGTPSGTIPTGSKDVICFDQLSGELLGHPPVLRCYRVNAPLERPVDARERSYRALSSSYSSFFIVFAHTPQEAQRLAVAHSKEVRVLDLIETEDEVVELPLQHGVAAVAHIEDL